MFTATFGRLKIILSSDLPIQYYRRSVWTILSVARIGGESSFSLFIFPPTARSRVVLTYLQRAGKIADGAAAYFAVESSCSYSR